MYSQINESALVDERANVTHLDTGSSDIQFISKHMFFLIIPFSSAEKGVSWRLFEAATLNPAEYMACENATHKVNTCHCLLTKAQNYTL